MFSYDEEVRRKILQKYNHTEETFQQEVDNIRKWLENQHHLPEVAADRMIAAFLIINKCRLERAKERIDMYYTVRGLIPELFENTNPKLPHMQEIINKIYWIPMPNWTDDMYKIYVFKLKDRHFTDFSCLHFFALTFLLPEIQMLEEFSMGDVLVYDLEGLSLDFLQKLTASVITKTNTVYEKVYSSPMKAIHFVNSPVWVDILVTAVKSLLKPKLAKRIYVHTGTQDLHKFFPVAMLPVDYGGTQKSLDELNEMLKVKYAEYQWRFDQLDTMRVNDELRPEKLKNDEFLGFHGKFTKLDID